MSIHASKAVHIGDDEKADKEGASAVGIDCWSVYISYKRLCKRNAYSKTKSPILQLRHIFFVYESVTFQCL